MWHLIIVLWVKAVPMMYTLPKARDEDDCHQLAQALNEKYMANEDIAFICRQAPWTI